ncbi:dsrm domain containing protein [Trichuris trichiura]|uniref:Dsrm domain containing protein n=1 Tax=Trichuris trichiura TaxID=36087 RepID=A0A077ZBD1_TRITR|nr:dsrm domain containing protein [Trichuris trichiura]
MCAQLITQCITIFIPTFETSTKLHQVYKWTKKPALSVLNELKHMHRDLIYYQWYTTVGSGVVTCSVLMVWGSTALRAQASANSARDAKHFAAEILVHFLHCQGWLPPKLLPQVEQTAMEFTYDPRICEILQRYDVKEVTKLYQIQQKRGRPLPEFHAYQCEKPQNRNEMFMVNATCEGYSVLGYGESKRAAKEHAAAEMNKVIQSFMMFSF